MFSSRTDLPDSPYGFPVNLDKSIPGTSQVVRFTVQFTSEGPQVVAAVKDEGFDFTHISIADLPPFTASSRQAQVLATLQQSAIACFHGKVHFLPDPLALYGEWQAELTHPELSQEEQRRLRYSIDHATSGAKKLKSLLVLENGSNKLKKLPLIGKVVGGLEKEILLPQKAAQYQHLGLKYEDLSNHRAALVCHHYSLNLAIEIKNGDLEGIAYGNLGKAYDHLGEYRKAIKFHQKHLEIAKKTKNLAGEDIAYNGLGNVYHSLGEYREAIEFHEKHLEIAKKTKNLAGEGIADDGLGNAYYSLGEYRKAIDFHEKSLEIAQKTADLVGEGITFGNLGNAYHSLGEYRKALEFFEKYLGIAKKTDNLAGEGRAYSGLGITYFSLGEYRKAIEFHEKHLGIAKRTEDLVGEGRAYSGLGSAYYSLGEYRKAIDYHEKDLEIAKKTEDLPGEGRAYSGLGSAYLRLEEYKKAIKFHEKDLEIAQKTADLVSEGIAYDNLGKAYHSLGEYGKAIEFHKKDLEIAQKIEDLTGEGMAYSGLGNAYHGLGEYRRAIEFHEKHLEIAKKTENLEGEGRAYGNLGFTYKEHREYPLAIEAYKESIKIFTRLQKENTEGNIQTDVAFFETLFYPFRALEELFATGLAASEVNASHEALRLADSARSRALVGVLAKETGGEREPLSVKQMQEIAAQHQTTFLLYSCSPNEETKGWVWVIPPKGEITHRFLDLMAMKEEMKTKESRPEHLQNVRGNRDNAFVEVADWVTRGRMFVTESDLAKKSKVMHLWYESLIGPIKDKLPQEEGARLTIVPDAVFGDLPFSTFTDSTGKTLLEDFTLSQVPSIQVLAYLDTLNKKKEPTRDLTRACIVANPEQQLQPMLPGAEREGKEVSKLFKNPDLFVQANATLENVKAALPKAGFIHLACHGLTVDQDEKPIKKNPNSVFQGSFLLSDQELYAEDLMETPLQAQLAVLSACHSGKGSLLKEGVVGPMHALLAAGVPAVVGTHWEIPDEATKLIIEKFYHFYLNKTPESQKAQERPFGAAEALREALLFMKQEVAKGNLKSPNPKGPDFTAAWGAFFLVGLPGK